MYHITLYCDISYTYTYVIEYLLSLWTHLPFWLIGYMYWYYFTHLKNYVCSNMTVKYMMATEMTCTKHGQLVSPRACVCATLLRLSAKVIQFNIHTCDILHPLFFEQHV